ncbi:MAG: hypothetical protein HOV80_19095 [Polyangiaceae bacterium]|nr:hypothetical protein [Polyangiaceae bacterium]
MKYTLQIAGALGVLATPSLALATTYQVGPSRPYQSLQEVESLLNPGDVVQVDGDHTYDGDIHIPPASSGSATNPVTIIGIPVNGKRPRIQGGSDWGIMLNADHIVFQGFEVTGSPFTCVINKGHDITLRDLVVHDCPGHGILGMDFETGDQTIEYTEVYACGDGIYDHQIYVATDETEHPGSRVRIQHSYIHDGNGGNNIKSRAERTEVYSNWIEAPAYHVFDLIGADGQAPGLAREDSDIVGNVLIQTGSYTIARIGGDGTGASSGRYRFAYNTIITSPQQGTIFRVMDQIESLAIHDNVFLAPNGGSPNFFDDGSAVWTSGSPKRSAQHNFVDSSITVPSFFSGTVTGSDAEFENYAAGNFIPNDQSPLLDVGAPGSGPSGFELPNALGLPTTVPPVRAVESSLQPIAREVDGSPDIGAYERGDDGMPSTTSSSSSSSGSTSSSSSSSSSSASSGSGATTGSGSSTSGSSTTGSGSSTTGSGSTGSGAGGDGGAGGGDDDGGFPTGPICTYAPPAGTEQLTGLLVSAIALLGAARRRRR